MDWTSKRENASMSVVRRPPRYYCFLAHLKKMGMTRILFKELSEKMGLTASQIRQDLNCFGKSGQQGYGHTVGQLQREIGGILGFSNSYKAILIGAGNPGQVPVLYMVFTTQGFQLVGIFDNSPSKIGTEINGITVTDTRRLKELYEAEQSVMVTLCIPRGSTEKFSEQLYSLGARSFWNSSHFDISMKYPDVVVKNVHLNDSLMTLCYRTFDHQEERDVSDDTAVQE